MQSQAQTTEQTTSVTARQVTRNNLSANGTGGAGGNATGGVGNVTVNNNARQQVPGLALGFMQPPACGVSFTGGGAGQQGIGALGFSWETESCRKHRLATALANMGRIDAAVALLCSMDEIQEALSVTTTPCPSRQQQPTMVAVRATQVVQPAEPAPAVVAQPVQRQRPAYCAVHASRGIPPTQECM